MRIFKFCARIFLVFIIIFSILFTLFFGRFKITQSHSFGSAESYKGILTLWQVDSFEGGTGSRKQFLLKVARAFERQNEGVLVMVLEHTPQSVKESLLDSSPDLISFGIGTEIGAFSQINAKAFSQGGMVGQKSCALPWCRGGYTLIANPKLVSEIGNNLESLLVSQGEYTQPLVALYMEGISASTIEIKSPMDAYVQFVAGKTPYFLGTQRDINRLERRGVEVITRPLTKYNDLYQYVALTSSDSLKASYAEQFIETLLSPSIQQTLSEIGMMSEYEKVSFANSHLSNMQNLSGFSTVSAFVAPQSLKEMQENSLLLMGGKKELENKIKNMLV